MKVLIDTNILLYILFDDLKLSKNEIEIISDDNNEIIVSSISLFEISLKYSINKLELNNIKPDKIPDLLIRNGYIIEDIDYITYSSYYKLQAEFHKDPFDRLLIWEAIRKDYSLLSKDRAFVNYEKYGLKLL
mgnify:FL=1